MEEFIQKEEIHIHGGDVYRHENILDFSANINPLGMPESVQAAAVSSISRSAHYPDVKCEALINSLVQHEQVEPQMLICGNGAADLIYRFVLAIKPERALLLAPCFAEYAQALRVTGTEIIEYHLQADDEFQVQEDIFAMLDESIDMMFICNPNNPTGMLTDQHLLEQIIERCKEKQIYLMIDECFNDFLEDPKTASVIDAVRQSSYLIILKAFTKMYAMPGLRLGYAISGNSGLISRMKQAGQPWAVSVPAQMAGAAALKEEAYVSRTRSMIQKERQWLYDTLDCLPLKVYPGKANYLFFQGPEGLKEACLKQGVLIRDCSNYSGLTKGWYRVAVRLREENKRLAEVLKYILREKEGGEV